MDRVYSQTMLSQRSTLSRLVAVILPLCSVWIFIACVIICSAHAEEASNQRSTASFGEAQLSHEEECCPINNAQVSVLPNRRATFFVINHNHPSSPALCTWLVSRRTLVPHTIAIPSAADPPFERFPTLRV